MANLSNQQSVTPHQVDLLVDQALKDIDNLGLEDTLQKLTQILENLSGPAASLELQLETVNPDSSCDSISRLVTALCETRHAVPRIEALKNELEAYKKASE